MKHLFFISCIFLSQYAFASSDSLLIKIDKRNQTLIGSPNGGKSQSLHDALDRVFKERNLVLSDSLWQNIRTLIKTDSEGDSSLSVRIGASQVKIGVIKSGRSRPTAIREDGSDTLRKNQLRQREKQLRLLGGAVQIQPDGKEMVRMGKDGIYVKEGQQDVRVSLKDGIHVTDGKEEVHVDWNGVQVKEANGEETKVIWGQDSTKTHPKERSLYKRKGFYFNLGINGINGKPETVQIAIYPPLLTTSDFELKTARSTYVSLGFDRSINLINGKKSAWRLGYGLGVDWYNFQFDHVRVIQKVPNNQTIFQPIIDSSGDEVDLKKNKLGISYVTLPLMSEFVFRKESTIQMISLGGYASYRLASWSKTVEQKSGDKNTEDSNFNLNQFRYGLRAEFAIRRFPDLFFNYDLNPMFATGTGLKMSAFSFGIRLL